MSANWVTFLGAASLSTVLFGRSKPSWIWIIAVLLLMIAGQAFSDTDFGAGTGSKVFGFFGPTGSSWLFLFALAIAIFDVGVDKKLDKKGAVALFVIPLLLIVAGTSDFLTGAVNSAYVAITSGAIGLVGSVV